MPIASIGYCMPFSPILIVNPGSPGLESSVLVSGFPQSWKVMGKKEVMETEENK